MFPHKLEKKVKDLAICKFELPKSKFRHFTFITLRNNIVICGRNHAFKTTPLSARLKYKFNAIHSEIDAIRQADKYLVLPTKKYKVVNVRLNADLNFCMAKPCSLCTKVLVQLGFREIWYTNEHGQLKEL